MPSSNVEMSSAIVCWSARVAAAWQLEAVLLLGGHKTTETPIHTTVRTSQVIS